MMKKEWLEPKVILLSKNKITSGTIFIMGSEGISMNFMGNVKTVSGTCYYTTIASADAEMNTMNATLFTCS